jgi:organic hydroperoxide reductase OsmC/OhrA
VYFDHVFEARVQWSGSGRDHAITAGDKPPIDGSAAKAYKGDPGRWNPEELLIASLSQCHMLSYLYSAAKAGIVVTAYEDDATGIVRTEGEGGRFESVTLRPVVTISSGDVALAESLHAEASRNCFIAASINFPLHHEPKTVAA